MSCLSHIQEGLNRKYEEQKNFKQNLDIISEHFLKINKLTKLKEPGDNQK